MALMRFCSSLPTMLKFSKRDLVTSGGKMVKDPVAFKSIDDSTSVLHGVLIFWSHQEDFNCFTSFEVHLHPMAVTSFLEAFTEPPLIWNNDVWFLVGVRFRFVLNVIVPSDGWILHLHLDSIEGPCGVLAGRQSLIQVIFFLFQQLGVRADGLGSMQQGANHTILRW